jgi:hypothetical protein
VFAWAQAQAHPAFQLAAMVENVSTKPRCSFAMVENGFAKPKCPAAPRKSTAMIFDTTFFDR